jgi:DNA-binding NtrC family response regulator
MAWYMPPKLALVLRTNNMARILLVDDDDHVRRPVQMNLTRTGHQVVEARNGREAMDIYRREQFDVVITDLIMPEQEGLETIQQLKKHNPAVRVIAISGGGRLSANNYLQLAERLGAQRTLAKPFTTEELVKAIADVMAA